MAGFLGNIGNAVGGGMNALGGAVHNVENYFAKPNPYPQLKSPIPTSGQVAHNLPAGVKSPIPQNNITPHIQGPSGFQNTMGNIQSAMGQAGNNMHQWAGLFNPPAQQGPKPTPMPQMGPPAAPLPGQQAWQQANQQLLKSYNPQQQANIYKQGATSPGGHYFGATPTPTPMQAGKPMATPTSIPHVSPAFLQTLNQQILPITRKAGIPDAVVAAQAAAESAYGSSQAAQNNNYFGIMAFHDANGNPAPRHVRQFASPGESAQIYAQTIQNLVPNYQQFKNNPLGLLQALQQGQRRYEADNPNPMQYVYDISHTPVWQPYGGGNPYAVNPNGWKR